MRIRVWGARGSVPDPGPGTMRYGGNTSCVQVTLDDGTTIVLDAGTGIRELGLGLDKVDGPLHILLTHLHLDHIQGLMFFAPMFRPEQEIIIWGPAHPDATLRDRIARYISAPLMPVEIRELPCAVSFREAESTEWEINGARVCTDSVSHRGPTLGYRITEGATSVCYIPDHEPGLGASLDDLEDEWISGLELARGADLLMHDAQYTDEEYPKHLGWGHSSTTDLLAFARRAQVGGLLAFHHDPLHDDETLDRLSADVRERWSAMGRAVETASLATEGMEFEMASQQAA
jgi:phosphoribosyl 1,2-cyclic phosphodiesterase